MNIDNLPKPIEISYKKYGYFFNPSELAPIVFHHDLFCDGSVFDYIGPIISNYTGRRAFSIDARNHGTSSLSDTFNYPALVSDLIAFIKKEKMKKAIFIGHGLGGKACTYLAMFFPEHVEKLIILDAHPTKHYAQEAKFLCAKLKELIDKIQTWGPDATVYEAKTFIQKELKGKLNLIFISILSLNIRKKAKIEYKFDLDRLKKFVESTDFYYKTDKLFEGPTLLFFGTTSKQYKKFDNESFLTLLPKAKILRFAKTDHNLVYTEPEKITKWIYLFIEETDFEKEYQLEK